VARAKNTVSSDIHTRAYVTLEQNNDGILHLLALQDRELKALRTSVNRKLTAFRRSLDPRAKKTSEQRMRSIDRIGDTIDVSKSRLDTVRLWQVVLLVTCAETYLQDVLSSAARIDPQLMRESKLRVPCADVFKVTSLNELAIQLSTRWARAWVDDGGPSKWISALGKM
jgi:hypothetical protein